MPNPSVIDIESMLKPIPGENPAGKDVDKDRVTLEQLTAWRKEDDPADYALNDPNRPKVLQPARWPDIVRLCKEQLIKESKYPTLGAFMTEALIRLHGFAGARDGFILQRRLAEQFMESLYPNRPVEEESDIDKYLNGIKWLSEKNLDQTLREASLLRYVNAEEGVNISVALADLRSPQNQSPAVDENKLSAFLLKVPVQLCTDIHTDVKECLLELDKLLNVLFEKTQALLQKWNETKDQDKRLSASEIKNLAFNKVPGLTRCKEVLGKAQSQLEEMIQEKANSTASEGKTTTSTSTGGESGKGGANMGQSRNDLYEQLRKIAKQLEKIDAHSPVPLLILKAVQLRELNFPKLVDVLTRDAKVLQFINSDETPGTPAAS